MDGTVSTELAPAFDAGETIIDGGNSYHHDDLRRAEHSAEHGIWLLDCGTSGGVWGQDHGYSLP
jgi:6-phosphogluconate dehydrogenase